MKLEELCEAKKSTEQKIADLKKSIEDQEAALRKLDYMTLPRISKAISPKLNRLGNLQRLKKLEDEGAELATHLSKEEFLRQLLHIYKSRANDSPRAIEARIYRYKERIQALIDGARKSGHDYPELKQIEKSLKG
jgi:hypothetical protein